MRKMLKHIGMPIAVASIAVIVVLAWTMILSPAQAVAQSAQEARAYITVEIRTGDDSVSWSDPDACSSGYNIYLVVNTLVQGSSTGQVTRTHLASAASGSTQATLPISHSGGSVFMPPSVKVELYCGEYDSSSSQNVLVASTRLSSWGSSLRSGTFSSAPLTALSVASRTLSPSFNRGIGSYSAEVPSDERRVTLSATGLTGYQIDYVKNPSLVLTTICGAGGCSYYYGGTTTTGIVLADVDPNTSGFQVDLDGGENRLGIGLHKGNEGAGISIYHLTITVQSVPATGKPTISGTAQVGQTLTANTAGISDEDGLDDANFSYQWVRVNSDSTDIDITDATSSTYAVASADTDKTIKVRVTFTDDAGNQESLTSAATSAVTQVAALSTDATLSALILSGVNLGTFDSATTSYTARVNGPVTETTVAPTLNHSGANYVIKLGGVTDADGVIQLTVGSNVITMEVTAEDGQTTRTYTITVTRLDSQPDPISSDATLSGLTLSGIDFGTFASSTESYTAGVANSVSQTTVTPTVNDSGASYVIKIGGVEDADGTVSLAVGSNVITVQVVAEDDSITKTYAVTVARAESPNSAATGAPTVSGTAQVGQTLTASTSDITDSDGLSNATFAYQWLTSRDAEIDGATSSAYTLVGADEGKSIKVRVSFTDDRGQQETLTSGATAIVAASPSPLTASIHGAPTSHDGQSVLKLELRFSEEFSISYVTLRDHAFTVTGGSVVGARRLERGKNIRWELGVRPDSNADVTVVLPVTTDCATQGAICTGDGRKLSKRLEFAFDGPVVSSPNSAATGAPTIGGTAQVGQTLTASTSGITDSDGLSNATFAYQWLSSDGTSDSDISGATSSAYTLVETDEGKTVKVRVSFTDDADNAETLTSGATAVVAAARSPLTVSLTGGAPTSHDGSAIFTFEMRFSEETSLSYRTLQLHAFTVTGGSILKAQRTNRPSNIPWRITVQPGSSGDIGIVLPATSDCGATGAICTEDGRMLSNQLELTVRGPGQ